MRIYLGVMLKRMDKNEKLLDEIIVPWLGYQLVKTFWKTILGPKMNSPFNRNFPVTCFLMMYC